MPIATGTISIKDDKNKLGRTQCYLDYPAAIAEPRDNPVEFMQDLALLIDALIGGRIVGINVTMDVPLPGGLKTTATSTADVEERGIFKWMCGTPELTVLMGLPTFREELIVQDTDRIDLTDPDVAALIAMMLVPIDLPAAWNVHATEERGVDITALLSAYERFKRR